MSDLDDFLTSTLARQVEADKAPINGDPGPRLAIWWTQDPVTVLGAMKDVIGSEHRSPAVIHGQPRSMLMPAELQDQPIRSWPRVLPKLAVRPPRPGGRPFPDGGGPHGPGESGQPGPRLSEVSTVRGVHMGCLIGR